MDNRYIIIAGLTLQFIILIILSYIKAEKHLEYLRNINPMKYSEYKSYWTSYSSSHYNMFIQFLFCPFFKRHKEVEDNKSEFQAKEINRFIQYQLGSLFLLILYLFYILNTY